MTSSMRWQKNNPATHWCAVRLRTSTGMRDSAKLCHSVPRTRYAAAEKKQSAVGP
jgi:hypothetical protein